MRLWERIMPGRKRNTIPLYVQNTLTGSKQEFTLPPTAQTVRMYNCGPTVYGPQHIGNLSYAVFVDILRRVLDYNGFTVKQVMNFTDVGHLTSDSDEGDDKMKTGLKREGLPLTLENMKALGERYASQFLSDVQQLNIDTSRITFPRASNYIDAQIAMIATLEEKGYAYRTKKGVYFDTSRFPEYGVLGGIDLSGLKEGARVAADPEKRNPTDFNLWKLSRRLGWDSPWGKGYPGWHIECSAMIHSILGKQIDIHTGGIEHIPVHHNNEIAQSESATGKKPFSRFWLHRAHLQIGGAKIAKSSGNTYYLSDILGRGFNPLSFRYLLLTSHYHTPTNFTWEALEAAQNTLFKLYFDIADFFVESAQKDAGAYIERFHERINDDLDTPGALAVLWDMVKDTTISSEAKIEALKKFDTVLGLNLKQYLDISYEVPPEIQKIVLERTEARNKQDWKQADLLREQIERKGYMVKDTEKGPRVQPIPQQQNSQADFEQQ